MNKSQILKTIQGLVSLPSVKHLFSAEIQSIGQAALTDRSALAKLKVDEKANYERKAFSSLAATMDLLTQQAVEVDGISTFAHKKLSNDTVITDVKFSIAKADVTVGAGSAAYSFKAAAFPDELANADLVIRYAGSEALRVPVRELIYDGTEKRNIEAYFGFNLLTPLVVKAGVALEAQIVMPEGVSVAAGGTDRFYTEIQFKGAKISVRNN